MASPLEQAILLLRRVYTTPSNDERRAGTEELFSFLDSLDGDTTLAVGVGILQTRTESSAVQAYGAILLKKGIQKGIVVPHSIPFFELFGWYWTDANVSGLLAKDLMELIVELIIRDSPETLQRVLGTITVDISGNVDVALLRKQLTTLSILVKTIIEPSVEIAPLRTLRPLQAVLQENGRGMLHHVLEVLARLYTDAGFREATTLPFEMMEVVEWSAVIIGVLSPLTSLAIWQELNLKSAFETLLSWKPVAKVALGMLGSVVKGLTSSASAEMQPIALELFDVVLSNSLPYITSSNDYDTVSEVIELLEDSRPELLTKVIDKVMNVVMLVFKIPSLFFASRVCTVLCTVKESFLSAVNVLDFCDAIYFFAQKHQCHPVLGVHALGSELSRVQLNSEEQYDVYFGSLRNAASQLLGALGTTQPVPSNQYILYRIEQLPNPQGTATDPRTKFGSVTQQSQTFILWDATSFIISRLSESFTVCDAGVDDAVRAFMGKNTSDAVLRPCYLEILVCFWKTQQNSLFLWENTLNVLFSDLENTKSTSLDEDVLSGRRRVCVLLIRSAKSAHAFQSLVPGVLKRLEAQLLLSRGAERSMLYEASSLFSAALATSSEDNGLRPILDPILEQATSLINSIGTLDNFVRVLMGTVPADRDARRALQEALGILCSSLKADCNTPYFLEVATRVQPILKGLFGWIHGLSPQTFPPPFDQMVFMSLQDYETLLIGGTKRSVVDRSDLGEARTNLTTLRFSVYQLQGFLCRLLPLASVLDTLEGLGESLPRVPIHWMRTLMTQTLLPMIKQDSNAIIPVMNMLQTYCSMKPFAIPQPIAGLSPAQEEQVRQKLWSSLATSMIIDVVEKCILGSDVWKQMPGVVRLAMDFLCNIGYEIHAEKVLYNIRKLFTMESTEADPEGLHEMHAYAFRCIANMVIMLPPEKLQEKTRTFMCCSLADFFLHHFGDAEEIMCSIGSSRERVEKLRGCLLVTPNPKARMHRCKDFLLEEHTAYMQGGR